MFRYAAPVPMMRVLLVRPGDCDSDVQAHARAIASLANVEFHEWEAPPASLALTLRAAAELRRKEIAADVLITAGIPALAMAYLAWHRPIVHLPCGRVSRVECAIIRRLARRGTLRLVTTSPSLASRLVGDVINAGHVRVIRSPLNEPAGSRARLRHRLELAPDQPVIYLPGLARPGSNHRLALWAANILIFRDPRVRLLLRPGGPRDGFVDRFTTSGNMRKALIMDRSLTEPERSAVADVALCTADGAPDVAPLLALTSARTPIIALESTWRRESLGEIAANLVDPAKPRLLARAALAAIETGRQPATQTATATTAGDWQSVFSSLGL